MRRLQSIICFNGGSAGDFLKALCLLAWDIDQSTINHLGLVDFDRHYFKDFCMDLRNNKCRLDDINWDLVYAVENSHYYLPMYKDIANNLYYINYSDSINHIILSEYVRKRHKDNWTVFFNKHINSIPTKLQSQVNEKNCQRVFEIQWIKNLTAWRSNNQLMPIEFTELLSKDRTFDIVQRISNKKIINTNKFDQIYETWKNNNAILFELAS